MKFQKSASPTPKAAQKPAPRPLKAPPNAGRKAPATTSRGSLHRSVAQDIGARILNGEFAPGTLLPNEAEWCKSFGVSRTAVREAIKMLMGKGLIISRPRIGSRVLPRAQWNLLDRDVLGWYVAAAKQSHFLAHMQQVREILEPETAALAAANHTAEQMQAIEEAYAAMAAAKTLAAWNDADVKFHFAILQAAGNELLVPLGFMIESALSNMFAFTAAHNEDMRKALPLHEAILTAIKRRSADAARKAARILLADTNNVIGRSGKRAARAAKANGRKRSA